MYIDDTTRLRHMLDAARLALESTKVFTLDELLADELRVLGLEKCVEVVGEAAYKISVNFRNDHPEIPWQTLLRLRNYLVHDYSSVDVPLVWRTVTDDFPELVANIEDALKDA